ncbi:MAG: CsbD family protein [Pseudobdellovibrio sp.]
MQLNENTLKGKWLEIKGDIQKTWGKLTDDELEKTKGDMKAVAGLIQQKYGQTQSDFNKKLDEIYQRFDTAKDQKIDANKPSYKN